MKGAFNYLKQIFFLLGRDRRKLPLLVLIFISSSLLDLLGLGLIGPYITSILSPDTINLYPVLGFLEQVGIPTSRSYLTLLFGITLVFIFFFKGIVAIFINRTILRYSSNQQVRLRMKTMEAYQSLPYSTFVQRNSSEYIQTIHTLTAQFSNGVVLCGLRIVSDGLVALVIISMLIYVNWLALFFLTFLVLGLIFLYDQIFRTKLKHYGERLTIANEQVTQGIQEGIGGLKEVRILRKEYFFFDMVTAGSKELAVIGVKRGLISGSPRYVFDFILILFLVVFVSGTLLLKQDIQSLIPTLGIFGAAALRLIPAANSLSQSLVELRFSRYAVGRLYDDITSLTHHTSSRIRLPKIEEKKTPFRNIVLTNISFSYDPPSNFVLRDLCLTIEAGDSIGFVGRSGSGKTTLVDLLLGLLEPQAGTIMYNGIPLEDVPGEWETQVAYLPQETFIIDNTLATNITLDRYPSDQINGKLREALQQARLWPLVEQLPDGVNTTIGEHGVRLSGGQRQRIALARAFYHDRNVLILDEATSALDDQTEKEIVDEIQHLKNSKTLIVIAHRLTTLRNCDRIYELKDGLLLLVRG